VACVNPDGTVTPSAIAILTALRSADTAELIAPLAGLPLFRVRSALRELVAAGLVEVVDGHHRLTDTGLARL
jgi:DNA-binding IclR family transcriptional regulator